MPRPFPLAVALGACALTACSRGQPPAWDAGEAGFASVPLPAPDDHADAGLSAPVDAGALPQTHDEPRAEDEAESRRALLLWSAITRDDPDVAMPFFFPLAAYEQVKAIAHPASDWNRRLVAHFKRDIHALHAELGAHPESAAFVRLDVPRARARWMEPGEEGNKLGYYRVLRSKLRFTAAGQERAFEVTSMISWRGEWYVVHLSGFE